MVNGENFIVKIIIKEMANNRQELTDIEIEENNGKDLAAYDLKVGRKNTATGNSSEVTSQETTPSALLSGNDIIINDLIDFVNSYTAKNININGIERPVFNSSGKRIAKTQEGLRAFYEWFGDSKVVDEQGRPLIVYHGTNADFDTFKKEYAKDGQYRKGFFFTSDKSAARMFGDIIMPVYLKAETDYRDAKKTGKEIDYIHPKNDNRDVYIVFDPNQIKSVDNRGSFSKESENIYHQDLEKPYSNKQLDKLLDNPQENKNAILDVYNNHLDKYNDVLASRVRTIARVDLGAEYKTIAKDKYEQSVSEKEEKLANLRLPKQISKMQLIKVLKDNGFIISNTYTANTGSEYITVKNPDKELEAIQISIRDHLQHTADRRYADTDYDLMVDNKNQWQDEFLRLADDLGLQSAFVSKVRKYVQIRDSVFYQTILAKKTDITTKLDPKQMRNDAKKYLMEIIRKQNIEHPDLGKIRVSTKGIKEFINSTGNLDKIALVSHLKELIETSKVGKKENLTHPRKDGIVAFYPLYNDAIIDEKAYDVTTKIGVDENGNLFYTILLDEKTSSQDSNKETKSEPIKEAVNINITPAVNIVNKTFNQDTKSQIGHRGQYDASNRIITLFSTADPSTIIHETAHFFLDDMRRFSDNETTKQQLEAIYKYVGSMDKNLSREQHEYFARSFEAYLMEGKAPNSLLAAAFRKFRNWLSHIYGNIKKLDVDLDDNIRKTFDDMLGGKRLDYVMQTSSANMLENIKSGYIPQATINKALMLLSEGKMSKADMQTMIDKIKSGELKRTIIAIKFHIYKWSLIFPNFTLIKIFRFNNFYMIAPCV